VKGVNTPFFLQQILSVKQLISKIIEEELVGTDWFLVGVDTNTAETNLKYFIDGTEGVSVQICTKLSRKISGILDEEYLEETPIRYEISSPGIDQPLIDKRQYVQHIGRDLAIIKNDNSEIEGELLSVDDTTFDLNVLLTKNKKETQTLAFDDINKCTVKVSFKKKKK
jgi:ribosome maturation factor RimP